MILKANQKALQVKRGETWEYVFCNNNGKIITTENRLKALGKDALIYFESKFANHTFRLTK